MVNITEESNIDRIRKAVEEGPDRNFLESVEVAINIKDTDLKIPKNRINEEIILPKGRGKPIKVALFGSGEFAIKAKENADLIIPPERIDELAENKREAKDLVEEFTFFIAETPLMPTIGKKLGIVLGPRGKMPAPIPPQADPRPVINSLKNKIRIRSRDRRTFHAPIGTTKMSVEDLAANYQEIVRRVESKLARGRLNIHSVYVKTTMGPSVRMI